MYNKLLTGTIISILCAFAIAKSSVILFASPLIEPKINIQDVTISNNPSNAMNITTKKIEVQEVVERDTINDWRLSATILGENPIAMLAKGNDASVMKIGEDLDSYKLEAIERNRVKFTKDLRVVWLNLEGKQGGGNEAPVVTAQQPTKEEVLNRDVNQDFFRKNLNEPTQLLQDVNILPILDGESFGGFKIAYLKDRSFLNVMGGLQENDIITEFNGEKLKSIADGINIYQKAMTLKNFTLKVKRDGVEKEIRYNIN